MELREYAGMAQRENSYFWHVGRREILAEALKNHLSFLHDNLILDIGCGTGGDILLLKPLGKVWGLDSVDEALKFSATRGFDTLVKGNGTALPFSDNFFNLVVALDVFEHIKDDLRAMAEAFRVLKPDGIFVVTVPAYRFLWSQHDLALHHFRRYTKRGLTQQLRSVGFFVEASSYFVMLGVIMNGIRKILDAVLRRTNEVPHVYDVVFSSPVNLILLTILRIERICLRFFPLPFGSSIMVVMRKPK